MVSILREVCWKTESLKREILGIVLAGLNEARSHKRHGKFVEIDANCSVKRCFYVSHCVFVGSWRDLNKTNDNSRKSVGGEENICKTV